MSMAFCGNCGADTAGGAFCPKCGASTAGAAPPTKAPGGYAPYNPPPAGPSAAPPAQAPGGYPPYTPPQAGPAADLQENIASALCYIPFLGLVVGIVFLVLQPYNQNKTIRFHAFQSIFFNLTWLIFRIGLSIILSGLGYGLLGFFFTLLHLFVWLVVGLGGFLLGLFLMWRAYNNNPLVLPIIGPIAQQQAAKM